MPTVHFKLVKDFIDHYTGEGNQFSDNLNLQAFGEEDASIKNI